MKWVGISFAQHDAAREDHCVRRRRPARSLVQPQSFVGARVRTDPWGAHALAHLTAGSERRWPAGGRKPPSGAAVRNHRRFPLTFAPRRAILPPMTGPT